MDEHKKITRLLESYQRAKIRYQELSSNPDTKKPTSHAQALEESERRLRTLEAEILSLGKNQKCILVEGMYKENKLAKVSKLAPFKAVYPDAPLELITMLVKQDFYLAHDLTFKDLPMRTKALKL